MILGRGMEGVVTLEDGWVVKRFFGGKPTNDQVRWLQATLIRTLPHFPEPQWHRESEIWCGRYPAFESEAVNDLGLDELRRFFGFCLSRGIVALNIKRANFRRTWQGLIFIDFGDDIRPMNVDFFRDACARGYVIAHLGWSDDELRTRSLELREESLLIQLPGFADWYSGILHEHAASEWSYGSLPERLPPATVESSVSLLIKACAMDAATLSVQVRHIVSQLESPRRFAERLLVLDPFHGPFLRQHCPGDWQGLLRTAESLRADGWLDRVLVAPDGPEEIARIHQRWFGLGATQSHCIRRIPVAAQVWGFDHVRTRYVLQCDVDIFVGRRDLNHDFLTEMLAAAAPSDVVGVAFNIPKDPEHPSAPYAASVGEYVPEVRCGLLDLDRIRTCRPLPNRLAEGRLELTWYRSLQAHQRLTNQRTLRGGDTRTFYVHPPNELKANSSHLDQIRDLVGQGRVPSIQWNQWDVVGKVQDWRYSVRSESLVFLIRGRNTPPEKVRRCLQSLSMQDDSDFGLILIDDASDTVVPQFLPGLLGSLWHRCTLVRRSRHHGYMPNLRLASQEIVSSPDAMLVILDLDDALMHRSVVRRLKAVAGLGHDVVLGAMFRPDKPIKLYHPDFNNPRAKWGGEVWIHLRSFEKRLIDSVPDSELQLDGQWIDQCEDYATMIPIVERATAPIYLPEYLYFHQRSGPSNPETRNRKNSILRRILRLDPD
jgi:hypothetical protein